jgi:hypothetical protein
MGDTVSFFVDARPADTARDRGVQILPQGASGARDPNINVEMELQVRDGAVRGGLGTRPPGVISTEGVRIFIRGMGAGTITATSAPGRGEIVDGVLAGGVKVLLGTDAGPDGACNSTAHEWSLSPR